MWQSRESRKRLFELLRSRGITISILINNAGFGAYGPFDSIDASTEEAMLDLDVKALVRLTRLFVAPMRAACFGRILLTASTARTSRPLSMQLTRRPRPSCSATVTRSAGSLHGSGVSVTVLSPGVTRTEFHRVAGHEDNAFKRATMMEVGPVVREAVDALLRGRGEIVPGFLNKAMVIFMRFVPRGAQAALAAAFMA